MLKGFANFRAFAWFSAMGSIAAPVVLAVIMLGVAAAYEPTDEELMKMQLAEIVEKAKNSPEGGAQNVSNRDAADQPEVVRLRVQFEEADSPTVQCDAARKLANMTGDDCHRCGRWLDGALRGRRRVRAGVHSRHCDKARSRSEVPGARPLITV